MGRKKIPDKLKAKNMTIKVYDWERDLVRKKIKEIRILNNDNRIIK